MRYSLSFFSRLSLLSLSLILVCSWVGQALKAQEPPAPEDPQTEAVTKPLREQTIYIPYKKLRETFEKEGRGVFLPYEQFRQLWEASRRANEIVPETEAPVKALITEIDSEASVGEGVVQVEATVSIDLLTEGWHEIPLRLADAAVQSATINDKPARLFSDANGYRLLVQHKGDKAETITLKLKYAKSYTRAPGQNRFEVQAPQASVNRWQIRIPDKGIKVQVHPMLAATEVPADADAVRDQPEEKEPEGEQPKEKEPAAEANASGETLVQAFVGAAPTVTIEWTPKAEGAAGLEVLATATSQQEIMLSEGVLRTNVRLVYEISRSELSQLIIEVPSDQKVAGLYNANVRQWQVAEEENIQKITVDLFEPAKEKQEISLELEKFLEEADQREVTVPVIKATGVARQQGTIFVRLAEGLRGQTSSRSGLLQLDVGEIPSGLRERGPWPFAYRYASLPFELVLSVEKEKPHVQVDQLLEVYLEPEKLTVDLLALYNIERAGLFELQLEMPKDYKVRQVVGKAIPGVDAVAVDTHRVEEGEEGNRLIVSLNRKAIGRVGLFVELEQRLQEPNLLSPTGKDAEITVDFPFVQPDGVERVTGRLIAYFPESLRAVPKSSAGLRNISVEEALKGTACQREGRFPSLTPVLSYAFVDKPDSLELSVQRRKPHVTVRQLLVGNVEPGVVKYSAKFFVDVLYSGAESLRIDLPKEVADKARNTTSGIRDRVADPAPEGLEVGDVAWIFTGESELTGSFQIELTWEQPIEKLDLGKSVELNVPRLSPQNVDRAWGQVVLTKAETIDLAPSSQPVGLQPIDPQHDLMPGASVPGAALGYEFFDKWELSLQATRFELQTVKTTSIERALVRMVVTRSDLISVQALYRLRSARQRLEVVLPQDVKPDGITFDTQPLRINGRSVALERGANDRTFYVPLVGLPANEPLLLELRYTQPGGPQELQLPEFPEEPAIQKVYLATYLPKEWTLLGSVGPWTDELDWYVGNMERRVTSNQDEHALLRWVSEDVPVDEASLNTFPTDGQMLLFSTLRPQSGSTLKLWTMHENWLVAWMIILVLGAGLWLLRCSWAERLVAIGVLVVSVMLCGVFAPTFAYQVLDWKLTTAVFVVLFLWVAKWLIFDRPSMKGLFDNLRPGRENPFASSQSVSTASASSASDANVASSSSKSDASSTSKSDSSGPPGESASGESSEQSSQDKPEGEGSEGGKSHE